MGRRSKRNHRHKNKSLRFALIFCLLVLFWVLTAFVGKIAVLFSESKFDGAHRFTIAINAKEKENNAVLFVSFAPDANSLSIVEAVGESIDKNFSTKDITIPVDEYLVIDKDSMPSGDSGKKHIEKLLQSMLFQKREKGENLTPIDIIRLLYFTKTVDVNNVVFGKIIVSSKDALSSKNKDAISGFFVDRAIVEENMSITIINGTGKSGYGATIADEIAQMGGNVVVVSTADETIAHSAIEAHSGNAYTVKKLHLLTDFPVVVKKRNGISDITILLGKDSLQEEVF